MTLWQVVRVTNPEYIQEETFQSVTGRTAAVSFLLTNISVEGYSPLVDNVIKQEHLPEIKRKQDRRV